MSTYFDGPVVPDVRIIAAVSQASTGSRDDGSAGPASNSVNGTVRTPPAGAGSDGPVTTVLSVAIPVAIYIAAVYGLYAWLMRQGDPLHIGLLLAASYQGAPVDSVIYDSIMESMFNSTDAASVASYLPTAIFLFLVNVAIS